MIRHNTSSINLNLFTYDLLYITSRNIQTHMIQMYLYVTPHINSQIKYTGP